MEILKHCRTYQLSDYYEVQSCHLRLPPGIRQNSYNNKEDDTTTENIQSLHLIEHSFHMSPLKRSLLFTLLPREECESVLIIDLISIWRSTIKNLPNIQQDKIWYLNSTSIYSFESIFIFLQQLIDSPIKALNRCEISADRKQNGLYNRQLCGIIIDNISYLQELSIQKNQYENFEKLIKLLKRIKEIFGSWIISVSYGNDYYNGVEMQLNVGNNISSSYSKIPRNYMNDIDLIVLRETEGKGRIIPFDKYR